MTYMTKIIMYGVLIWIASFLVALVLYPLRDTSHVLFQSVMSVVLVLSVTVAATSFSTLSRTSSVGEAIGVSFLWLVISLMLDFVILVIGPMHMTLREFIPEVGVTYLIIPILGSTVLYEIHSREGGETMKQNIGLVERVTRAFIGLLIIAVAIYFRSWWGLIGVELLLTSIFGWSPLYKLISLSTISPREHRYVS